ncbi:MAG: hypothetical protein V3V88_03010 [Dehalococcoidia bacterium]
MSLEYIAATIKPEASVDQSAALYRWAWSRMDMETRPESATELTAEQFQSVVSIEIQRQTKINEARLSADNASDIFS